MNLHSDLESLLGIPYRLGGADREGCDCWGLVELAFRMLRGIELPPYNRDLAGERAVPRGRVAAHALHEIGEGAWVPVAPANARALDVVLLRVRAPADHVGLVLPRADDLLTTARDGIGARIERWRGAHSRWEGRVTGVWRHARA